jgi:hypothetical protein
MNIELAKVVMDVSDDALELAAGGAGAQGGRSVRAGRAIAHDGYICTKAPFGVSYC